MATPSRGRSIRSGYTAIEVLLALGIMTVVSGMAMFEIGQAAPAMKGDGAMRVILAQLHTARELSITERRQMHVQFAAPNQIRIIRQEYPAGTTVLSSVGIEAGVEYVLVNGVPDTPESFGRSAAVDFGSASRILFNSDGTLIDQSGNPLNGTVFVAIPNQPRSVRAVTILGGTGRIRGYKWDGARWVVV